MAAADHLGTGRAFPSRGPTATGTLLQYLRLRIMGVDFNFLSRSAIAPCLLARYQRCACSGENI